MNEIQIKKEFPECSLDDLFAKEDERSERDGERTGS